MSTFVFTSENLQDLYHKQVEIQEIERKRVRDYQIQIEAGMITKKVFYENGNGKKTCTMYVYNKDNKFVSDIHYILCERFPNSTVTVNNYTIWRLFNYHMITIIW
jgi:predicted metal-binding protein